MNISYILGSNYPDCIVEGSNFVALCGGFPYAYRDAFSEHVSAGADSPLTLTGLVLQFAENNNADEPSLEELQEELSDRLKQVSGHFVVLVCHKRSHSLLVFNDILA